MTDYDYSPAAYERFLENQNRVSNWAANASAHANEFEHPFDTHHRPSHSRSNTLPAPYSAPPYPYPQPTSPHRSRSSSHSRSHSHHSHHTSHTHGRPRPVRAQTQFYAPLRSPVSSPLYHDRDPLYRAYDARTGREILVPVTTVDGKRVLMVPPGGRVMSPEPLYAAHLSHAPVQYRHPQPLLRRLISAIPWSASGDGSARRRSH